jgi:hypothetical protein
MYRRILLWTSSPIHHAAVHLNGIFRKTLKGKTFISVLGPTLIDNKLLYNSPMLAFMTEKGATMGSLYF